MLNGCMRACGFCFSVRETTSLTPLGVCAQNTRELAMGETHKKRDARSNRNGADEEKACFQSEQGCQRALFRGSLDHVFNAELSKASKRLAIERGMSKDLAGDAMKKRAILYLFQLLEGWVVSMARLVLQAASTSRVSASSRVPPRARHASPPRQGECGSRRVRRACVGAAGDGGAVQGRGV